MTQLRVDVHDAIGRQSHSIPSLYDADAVIRIRPSDGDSKQKLEFHWSEQVT